MLKCTADAPIVVYTSEPVKTRPVDVLTCSLGCEDEIARRDGLSIFVLQPESAEMLTAGEFSFRLSILPYWFTPLLLLTRNLPCW